MKANFLYALVVDQESDYARGFMGTIRQIFTKLYYEGETASALKEFQEKRPHIIFTNLNIQYRSEQFEFIEKLNALSDSPPLIFGYTDAQDQRLLAHALEAGIQDVFSRPFDVDIISSKINRYLQSEKTQERNLQYTTLTNPLSAIINLSLKIVAVDENGLMFRSHDHINKGTILPFSGEVCRSLFGVDTLELMVTNTRVSDDRKEYFLYAEPRESREQMCVALRKFILGKI